MQMSLKNRVLDMLPILLVFGVVTLFAAWCLVAYIISEPMTPPARASRQAGYATPQAGAATAARPAAPRATHAKTAASTTAR